MSSTASNTQGEFRPAQISENAEVVLKKRYLRKNDRGEVIEDPQGMFRRVANALADVERQYGTPEAEIKEVAERFYRAMASLEYVPNSPTLMNAGTGTGTLSACFVLPLYDSMQSIMDCATDAAMVQKFGGGTGFALSHIRPKGTAIRTTHGRACGPIAVLRHLSSVSTLVTQGGKRDGANMAVMDVHHPNILEFIDCKQVEGQIHNFNISVGVTDEFMRAVEAGTDYPLRFRENAADPASKPVEVGRLDARTVFRKIVEGAWRNGEPGMIFLDEVNRESPVLHVGRIEATNPCVTGDTFVLTADGPRQVRDLLGTPAQLIIDGEAHATTAEGFFRTGTRPVVRLRTEEGFALRLTDDHLVRRASSVTRHSVTSEWVRAADLRPGDRVILHDHRSLSGWSGPLTEGEGYLLGLLVGDGTLKEDKAALSVWLPHEAVIGTDVSFEAAVAAGVRGVMAAALAHARALPHRADFQGWIPVVGRQEYHLSLGAIRHLAERLGLRPGGKTITPDVEKTSHDFHRGFLRGLFDTDGSVQGNHDKGISVRLAQSDRVALQAAQRMLLRLGIASHIYEDRRPAGHSNLPNGHGGKTAYPTRSQHELVIANENLPRFAELVGFEDATKRTRLHSAIEGYRRSVNRERFFATVKAVTLDGAEDVYDVQVPGVNAFDANGLYVHNCGEQPLLPNESCNLGSINLAKFLADTSRGKEIEWQRLGDMVRLTVRFLDNVIDANGYAVPEIQEMTKFTRKIGLGVMGFADMLVEMGIPYDSEAGIELGRRVMRFIRDESDRASEELAAVRGPFPAFKGSAYEKEGRRPIRNACRLTVAPTGTISMIAGVSSGIEPLFSLVFRKHNILGGETLFYVDRNFERVARERGFYSEELMAFLADGGSLQAREDVPADVRRLFHVAADISPRNHVLMQAAFQESVDAGISKTINFPNSATAKDVEEAYLLAWKTRCKGITVYRAGSREKEVLTAGTGGKKAEGQGRAEETALPIEEAEAATAAGAGRGYLTPKERPAEVHGVTRRIRTGHGNVFITVNVNGGGRPFEVFATLGKAGGCDAAQHEAIGRLASLALRSGIDPEEVVKQLRGITCCPTWDDGVLVRSGPDAIALALQRQIEASKSEEAKQIEPRRESAQLGMFRGERPAIGTSEAKPVQEFRAPATVNILAQVNKRTCPDCGSPSLAFEEGCMKCYSCGFSKC